ncbi:hypothetical protein [Psychrobacter sp. UBA3962]|uniref:hypothetical protein n=1 Tax=Psychrobacter sp. UBA3962 TaxID=1947352 RepID=UPI0025F06125|nr:hypothetical protein [Psychrobacter sp. UBA3962]
MAKSTMTNMKHKTLAAVALAATMMLPSVGAQAANNDLNEVCVDIASLAGNIMDDRQNGVSKSQVTKKTKSDNEAYQSLAKNIIAEAYKVPQAKSAADKDKQVDNFIRQYYNKCAR